MRVLLVSGNRERLPSPVYPLALPYLAGALVRKGCGVTQIDLLAQGHDALESAIERTRPELVGVSIRNIDNLDSGNGRSYLEDHGKVVATIRSATRAPIVAGGSGFSLFPREVMRALGVDFGVIGAGEEAVCALVDALAGQCSAAAVPHLIEPGSEALRKTPCPAQGPAVHDAEIVDWYWRYGGMIGIRTKQGCPRQCSYCTYPLIEGRSVRYREPADVADEMERLAEDNGVTYFFMVDSVFNTDRAREEALGREIERRRLGIQWGAFFSPAGIDASYLRALKPSGLRHVELGSDSFSNHMLESYRKGFTFEDISMASNACADEDVFCAHYIVFGGPGETAETIHETVSNARLLRKCIIFPFAGVRVYPGTGVFAEARAAGLVKEAAACLEPVFYFAPGVNAQAIWHEVERARTGAPRWVLPAEYSVCEPMMQRFREHGIKGPMWEYLLG